MNEMQSIQKYADLIYDVGMHKGEDTDYYLKKGFRVVAFEANPALVASCRNRFSDDIKNGKLSIVEGAIVEQLPDKSQPASIKFYQNKQKSIWGTVDSAWAQRNEVVDGTTNEIIEVPVVNFSDCLKEHGIPYYMKIDIEGMDSVCLKALMNSQQKPDYISIESEKVSFDKLLEEFNLLVKLDYSKFKAVQQKYISRQREPNPSREGCHVGYRFQNGSSGLFGSDLPFEWKEYDQIIEEYKSIFVQYELFGDYGKFSKYSPVKFLLKVIGKITQKPIPGWYDTHAKHSSV